MNDIEEIVRIARRLAAQEGSRRTAGRLFNLAALLLAEAGISDDALYGELRAAFMLFACAELQGVHH